MDSNNGKAVDFVNNLVNTFGKAIAWGGYADCCNYNCFSYRDRDVTLEDQRCN